MYRTLLLVFGLVWGLWCCAPLLGQSKYPPTPYPRTPYPRTPWGGYPYPASYDAEVADPNVHRVLFENENIMFLEVANPPELDVHMHGHPYPSVFARDTGSGPGVAGVPIAESHLDPASPFAGKGWGQSGPPAGLQFPLCTTAPPEAPHKPINHGTVPVHFYRIEFRRLDGADFLTHWKSWYPWMLDPTKPLTNSEPGSDSVLAAPNDYQLLYEDGHVRLLEVTVRPGETTPGHENPYASVLAFNTVIDSQDIVDTKLDAKSAANDRAHDPAPGHALAPSVFNMTVPTCMTVAPQSPHTIRNDGAIPLHYYRIEFKRIDGDDFPSHWREWYPWMQYMKNMR
ncbi:MAG TPA: hypothetical protein VGF44_04500 [Terriglobales bacterium]